MRRQLMRSVPALLIMAVVMPASACSSGNADCEDALTAATMSVSGVVSAEWECSDQFGGGWERADVVVEAATEDEAIAVVDEVLQAYAAAPDLEDRWSTPQQYVSEDGSIVVSANDLGFNGPPTVGDVREHYGITPG